MKKRLEHEELKMWPKFKVWREVGRGALARDQARREGRVWSITIFHGDLRYLALIQDYEPCKIMELLATLSKKVRYYYFHFRIILLKAALGIVLRGSRAQGDCIYSSVLTIKLNKIYKSHSSDTRWQAAQDTVNPEERETKECEAHFYCAGFLLGEHSPLQSRRNSCLT